MFNIEKTQEEIVKEEMMTINQHSEGGLYALKNANWLAYDLFWNNPRVTPQEFCDLMGNEAYKLFVASGKTQAFIKSIDPTHIPLDIPENKEVAFGKDGTVTITDK